MFMTTKIKIATISVLLVGCVAIVIQQWKNAQLRRDLEIARQENQKIADAGASGNTDKVGAPSRRADEEHREIFNPAPRSGGASTNSGLRSKTLSNPEPSAHNMTAVDSVGNRGFTTPRDAFATQLWAARGGDIALEAKAIVLGPKARAEFDALLDAVPEDLRNQYKTPEELMAYALSGSPRPVSGFQVLGESPAGPDTTILQVAWQHEGSSDVITNDVRFYHSSDGWKMVVPPTLVDRALNYLGEKPPAPLPAPNHG